MKIEQVDIAVPDGFQLILGQSHFIKTVEDMYEALVTSMPGIKFGLAFCEASGKSLIRSDGTDSRSIELATRFAAQIASGHSFAVVLNGAFPINVLNRIKDLDEVATVFCATANSVSVLVAESDDGRGVLGVIDGTKPKGVETEADKKERREFLRKIGYKR